VRSKEVQAYFDKISRMGGHARAAKLTKQERSDMARKAAKARWAKQRKAEKA
jgi:hypothetical protein